MPLGCTRGVGVSHGISHCVRLCHAVAECFTFLSGAKCQGIPKVGTFVKLRSGSRGASLVQMWIFPLSCQSGLKGYYFGQQYQVTIKIFNKSMIIRNQIHFLRFPVYPSLSHLQDKPKPPSASEPIAHAKPSTSRISRHIMSIAKATSIIGCIHPVHSPGIRAMGRHGALFWRNLEPRNPKDRQGLKDPLEKPI